MKEGINEPNNAEADMTEASLEVMANEVRYLRDEGRMDPSKAIRAVCVKHFPADLEKQKKVRESLHALLTRQTVAKFPMKNEPDIVQKDEKPPELPDSPDTKPKKRPLGEYWLDRWERDKDERNEQ
jgi:hypothetical protein